VDVASHLPQVLNNMSHQDGLCVMLTSTSADTGFTHGLSVHTPAFAGIHCEYPQVNE